MSKIIGSENINQRRSFSIRSGISRIDIPISNLDAGRQSKTGELSRKDRWEIEIECNEVFDGISNRNGRGDRDFFLSPPLEKDSRK